MHGLRLIIGIIAGLRPVLVGRGGEILPLGLSLLDRHLVQSMLLTTGASGLVAVTLGLSRLSAQKVFRKTELMRCGRQSEKTKEKSNWR